MKSKEIIDFVTAYNFEQKYEDRCARSNYQKIYSTYTAAQDNEFKSANESFEFKFTLQQIEDNFITVNKLEQYLQAASSRLIAAKETAAAYMLYTATKHLVSSNQYAHKLFTIDSLQEAICNVQALKSPTGIIETKCKTLLTSAIEQFEAMQLFKIEDIANQFLVREYTVDPYLNNYIKSFAVIITDTPNAFINYEREKLKIQIFSDNESVTIKFSEKYSFKIENLNGIYPISFVDREDELYRQDIHGNPLIGYEPSISYKEVTND